ncbi:iron ABC transporter substrate-binding protein [candidate division KSB1 bacterium]
MSRSSNLRFNQSDTIILFTVCLVIISSGCSCDIVPSADDTVIITDMAGREVAIPEHPDRVAGIGAGALRMLVYAGAADMIAGVEDIERNERSRPYAIAHREFENFPSIGPSHGGDPELIAAARPDVIFWTYTTSGQADDLQEKTGIPVVVLNYGNLHEQMTAFKEGLQLIGQIINTDTRCDSVIQFIELTIEDLHNRTTMISERPAVYIGGVSSQGAHGITSTRPQYEPFLFINTPNVASSIGMEHAFIDKEQLIEWNPDIIFIDEGGYPQIIRELQEESALFSSLKAVRSGELYTVMPYNSYTTNFGTVLANAYYIGAVLYPDSFSDIIPEDKADEIYDALVGRKIYWDMKSLYGGFFKVVFQK